MKHVLKLLIALVFILPALTTNAQNKKETAPEKDGYVKMEKGQIIKYDNGVWGYLLDTYTCTNGEKITTDGTITKPDGSTAKLTNGQKIYMDGHMASSGAAGSKAKATNASAKTKHAAKQ